MRTKFQLLCFMGIILSAAAAWSQQVPQADSATPKVSVTQTGASWAIAGQRHKVILDSTDLSMKVQTGSVTWTLLPSAADDLTVQAADKVFSLSLTDAGKTEITPYETGFKSGLKIHLSQFRHEQQELDLQLQLFVCLDAPAEDLVCDVVAFEKTDAIKQCFWPKGFAPKSVEFTIVPFMQGMLLPRDWPKKVWLYDTASYSRGLYMPWWGHQKGQSAAMVILETPVDAGCEFKHPPGGPTRIQPRWVHSLGKLAYSRRARLCFFEKGNYVDMAKRYRLHVIKTGHFVSLREKIARSPILARLIGSPIIHTKILYHIQPESNYHDKKNPEKNHQLVRFDERAEHLRKLAAKGVKRAYVHLDGWGFRGYDNLHPDILPPCPEAGGWDGMRFFAETCNELDYIFAVHDQYRDYYLDAKSYDERHTIIQADGSRPFGNTWFGGKQSILCPRLALGHVVKNYRAMLAHGIKLRGAYLDVFAVVPPEECYNPEHPATRTDCLQCRGDCFDFIRTQVGIVSSEEPADWAIPHLDLVHHGPFALEPNPISGPAMGIPVPLFSLVYHDAILVPWSLTKGAWGIPINDSGYLHGLANAGLPYLSLNPDENELTRVRTMCALHKRVGMMEMTSHEFLNKKCRKQRTTFADGTTVTIDLDADTFQIVPELLVPTRISND